MSKSKSGAGGVFTALILIIIILLIILIYLAGIMFSKNFAKATMKIPGISAITDVLVGDMYSDSDDNTVFVTSSDADTVSVATTTASAEAEDTLVLSEKPLASSDYFNHCIFLGDSRTVAMVEYGYLFEEQTFAKVGISHDAARTATITYDSGLQYTMETYLTYHTNDIIYISYGVNGINYETVDEYEQSYEDLVDKVITLCPRSTIVLQSIWPVIEGYGAVNGITNAEIDYYNAFLKDMAERKGLYYLDTQSVLKDETGNMIREYSAGDGLHYDNDGYEVIMNYILTHTVPGYEDCYVN